MGKKRTNRGRNRSQPQSGRTRLSRSNSPVPTQPVRMNRGNDDSQMGQGYVPGFLAGTSQPPDGTPNPNEPGSPVTRSVALPPNAGLPIVEHIDTFISRLQAYWSKLYVNPDEAYRDSKTNASHMRRDPVVMQPLRERQLGTCMLEWQIVPPDEDDPIQAIVCNELTEIVKETPRLIEFFRNLSEAVWFGKYAINVVYRWCEHDPTRMVVDRWIPVHGDKLRFEHETGRVGFMSYSWGGDRRGEHEVRYGDESRVMMLNEVDRECLVVHKHEIEDGEFFDSRTAGSIHGIGLRTRVYWPWVMKQRLLQWVMDFSERMGSGIRIWYYEMSNPESEAKVREAASKYANDYNILFPRPIGSEQQGPGLDIKEAGTGGSQFMQSLLDEYFGDQIHSMIIGETLTSKSKPQGIGQGASEEHADTKRQIIEYDAANLAETVTNEFIWPLARWNFRGIDWKPRFEFVTKKEEPEKLLEACKTFQEMGGKLGQNQVREIIGIAEPDEEDEILQPMGAGGGVDGEPSSYMQSVGSGAVNGANGTNGTNGSANGNGPMQFGRWVTMGAHKENPPGEKGGSPVFIEDDGSISAGPETLRGRNVNKTGTGTMIPKPVPKRDTPRERSSSSVKSKEPPVEGVEKKGVLGIIAQNKKLADKRTAFVKKVDKLQEQCEKLRVSLNEYSDKMFAANLDLAKHEESLSVSEFASYVKEWEASFEPLRKEWDTVNKKLAESTKKMKSAFLDHYSVPKDQRYEVKTVRADSPHLESGGVTTIVENDSLEMTYRHNLKAATEFVGKLVRKRDYSFNFMEIPAHRLPNGKRPYARARGTDNYHPGIYVSANDGVESYVHELGHHLEYIIPTVQTLANEFRSLRIRESGTEDIKLSEKFPSRYEDWEIGNKDGFGDLFNDEGSAYYTGKRYEGRSSTEIISMGVQTLYQDPVGFARKDPEYFDFMIGILSNELVG